MKKRMSRLATVLGMFGLLTALVPATALAAKPGNTCPATASGWERVDPDGWWAITIEGFAEAGIAVYEDDGETFTQQFEDFTVAFGFTDAAEAEFFVKVIQFGDIDDNGNGYACIQDLPNTPARPGFIFNGNDDKASVPHT